jgi:type II secretory pathway component PulF
MSNAAPLPPTTLDDLIALNEELLALVNHGVPLEQGLVQAAAELRGRARHLAMSLASQLQKGEPLVALMANNPQSFPPIYRAAVEAGIRSGRLAAALESIARASRRLVESRRTASASLAYPMLVLVAAVGFLAYFLCGFAPAMLRVLDRSHAALAAVLQTIVQWGPGVFIAAAAIVGIVLTVWIAWSLAIRRASLLEGGVADTLLGRLPWMGEVLRSLRAAAFGEVLATLVEQGVPEADALLLAAEAAGGSRMAKAVGPAVEGLQRGQSAAALAEGSHRLAAPLMRWLLLAHRPGADQAASLRKLADYYAVKAEYDAREARLWLPIYLTCVIGGGATLLYGLAVFGAWISILDTLAH